MFDICDSSVIILAIESISQIMINGHWIQEASTPYLSYSGCLDDEAIVKPLKNEIIRDKLMPSVLA
jgi:hypothetical protein